MQHFRRRSARANLYTALLACGAYWLWRLNNAGSFVPSAKTTEMRLRLQSVARHALDNGVADSREPSSAEPAVDSRLEKENPKEYAIAKRQEKAIAARRGKKRSYSQGSKSLTALRDNEIAQKRLEESSRYRPDGAAPESAQDRFFLGIPVDYDVLRGLQGWTLLIVGLPTDLPFDNVPPEEEPFRWLSSPSILGAEFTILAGLMLIAFSIYIIGVDAEEDEAGNQFGYKDICTNGTYGYVRHPVYSGYLVIALGMCIFTTSPIRLFFSLALFATLYFKASAEEVSIRNDKGEAYDKYCEEVPCKFIPFLI